MEIIYQIFFIFVKNCINLLVLIQIILSKLTHVGDKKLYNTTSNQTFYDHWGEYHLAPVAFRLILS